MECKGFGSPLGRIRAAEGGKSGENEGFIADSFVGNRDRLRRVLSDLRLVSVLKLQLQSSPLPALCHPGRLHPSSNIRGRPCRFHNPIPTHGAAGFKVALYHIGQRGRPVECSRVETEMPSSRMAGPEAFHGDAQNENFAAN